MSENKRSPSPSPTVTLNVLPKQDLQRSSSEESIRVIHHAVLFPSSPHTGRVSYIRRTLESDAELIRRQQAAIALQPLTFAEELAAKRKQLEIRAEKRKSEKAAAAEAKEKVKPVPEITIIPASGKLSPSPASLSPTKMKARTSLKEKNKVTTKPTPIATSNRQQRLKPSTVQSGQAKDVRHDNKIATEGPALNNTLHELT